MAKSYTNPNAIDSERLPSFEEEPDEWKYHKMEKFRAREQGGKIPDVLPSKSNGPERLQNTPQKESAPQWEDLTDEEKALHKTPMRYARHLLENKMNGGEDNDQTSY